MELLPAILAFLNAGGATAIALGVAYLFGRGTALFRREHDAVVALWKAQLEYERTERVRERTELIAQRDGWQRMAEATTTSVDEMAEVNRRLTTAIETAVQVRVQP